MYLGKLLLCINFSSCFCGSGHIATDSVMFLANFYLKEIHTCACRSTECLFLGLKSCMYVCKCSAVTFAK